MKRLIVSLNAVPVLSAIGASLMLMEPITVVLCGILAGGATIAVASTLIGFARWRGDRAWPVFAGAVICLTSIYSVMTIQWPMRAAYLLSRPSLDRLAQAVRAGQPLVGPARVGLFTIVETEHRHGIVCLWVDSDPGGKMGFVQCGPDNVRFNLWSMVSMDEHWQFIKED